MISTLVRTGLQLRAQLGITLVEAIGTRFIWLLLGACLVAAGLGFFLGELALTEIAEFRVTMMAALLRPTAVFLLVTFVVTSVLRERAERRLEMSLAMAVPPLVWTLGRLLGIVLLAGALAALAGVVLLAAAQLPMETALWAGTLLLELCVVGAFALFAASSMGQLTSALGVTLAFYLVARALAAVLFMFDGHTHDASTTLMLNVLEVLSLVMPRLDLHAHSGWLLEGGAEPALAGRLALASLVYLLLLVAATAFDLRRRGHEV